MKKKLLIYAHYYYPDVASTGQLLQDLAEGLAEEFDITVICAIPSYLGVVDQKYAERKIYKEAHNRVKIWRVYVPPFQKGNKASRIKNLIFYYFGARKVSRLVGRQDYVLAISQPPILGGILGWLGKKTVGGKFIYCIQDFNPEQIAAVGYFKWNFLLSILKWVDIQTCKASDLIITVGRDLQDTLAKRFVGKDMPRCQIINNWIDERLVYPLDSSHPDVIAFREQYHLSGKFVFMYSGNIGLYYDFDGLIRVIQDLQNLVTPDGREVMFVFVGAGGYLDALKFFVQTKDLQNVLFIPYQDKEKLIFSLNAADVHFCINAKGIKGVSCPSKFYGIVAAGKPVLGVLEQGSEVERLMREIHCGKVSPPGNYAMIKENIQWFVENSVGDALKDMGRNGLIYFRQNLTRDISIQKYRKSILELDGGVL